MQREREDDDDEDHTDLSGLRVTTARLELRPPGPGDRATLDRVAADPLLGEAWRFGETCSPDDRICVIVERSTGRLIGEAAWCGVSDLPSPVEIGLWLDPDCWGVGFGTEATHALIDCAFADGRVGVLWSAIRVANIRARRVLEKSGFQYRGGGMGASPVGGAFPVERFVLDRRNWASLKAWGAEPLVPARRGAA